MIGGYAFSGCSSLSKVTIGNGVTTIENGAFGGCTALTSITIPSSVKSIGEGTFVLCSSLKEFKGQFASSDSRCLIADGVLLAFAPAGLTLYTIPGSVTTIGPFAFEGSSLTNITIPDHIKTIGKGAFGSCTSLSDVTIGNGVETIDIYAFQFCIALTAIAIPANVKTIASSAFFHCTALNSIYCKATTPPALGEYAFFYYYDSNYSALYNDNGRIYVPASSSHSILNAYKAAPNWGAYASQMREY